MFKPNIQQMSTSIRIQHRVSTDVNGAPDISYVDADPALDFCNWKGKGGTESVQSGSVTIMDTAELTMWFRPDVTERDRVMPEDVLNSWQLKMDALNAAYQAEESKEDPDPDVLEGFQNQINNHLAEKPAYEVVNVENIEMRNQYMILKVRRAVNA